MHHEHVYILRPELVKIAQTARVDAFVKIEGTVTIGEFVHIASFCHIGAGGGEVIMEDHCGCSSGVVIASGYPDLSYEHISAADPPEHRHPIRTQTVIGKHVVIFPKAVINPGVMVGDHAVVLGGAVVTKNVLPYDVVGGVPARTLGVREKVNGRLKIRWLDRAMTHRDLAATFEVRPKGSR